jgi:DNA-binding CsgD family transcriptional regulator
MAGLLCLTGEWDAALDHARRGLELSRNDGTKTNEALLWGRMASVAAHRGDKRAARTAANESIRASAGGTSRTTLAALGLLELSLRRPDAAHEYLGPLVADVRSIGIVEPGAMRFATDDVEALVAVGDLDAAETLLDWYEGEARRLRRRSALATSARCRGLLASARGAPQQALDHLAVALQHHDAVPLPFERARTLLSLGATQRRLRRRRDARATLDGALAAFEALGANLWVERTREEIARIGGRTPIGDELTPTERRVAELAAAGRRNREVARELFLSEKTVEFHLRNVFRKLGIRARTELSHRLGGGA